MTRTKVYTTRHSIWAASYGDNPGVVELYDDEGKVLEMSAAMAEDLAERLQAHAKWARNLMEVSFSSGEEDLVVKNTLGQRIDELVDGVVNASSRKEVAAYGLELKNVLRQLKEI
jgi:hypothetical protein